MKWYRMESKENGDADVYLLDVIGAWGITASDFVNSIKNIKGKITLHINSPGGSVWEGLAIYNILKGQNADVVIEGLAASMASVIALAGNTVKMAKNSMMMIHNPATMAWGEEKDLQKQAGILAMIKDQMIDIYSNKTGLSKEEVSSIMDAETWYTPEEAKAKGFCDVIIDDVPIENTYDSYFNNQNYQKFVAMQQKPKTEERMDEILALLGATNKEEAVAKIKELKETHAQDKQRLVEKTVEMDIQAKRLLPSQKAFAVKMLSSGESTYAEFLQSIQKPEDLTIPTPISGSANTSGITYQQLLDDPALYVKMMQENPALVQALEKGGK